MTAVSVLLTTLPIHGRNKLRGPRRHNIILPVLLCAKVVVDLVPFWIECLECFGDACAPVALGVAGVDEEGTWWGGEDVARVVS